MSGSGLCRACHQLINLYNILTMRICVDIYIYTENSGTFGACQCGCARSQSITGGNPTELCRNDVNIDNTYKRYVVLLLNDSRFEFTSILVSKILFHTYRSNINTSVDRETNN